MKNGPTVQLAPGFELNTINVITYRLSDHILSAFGRINGVDRPIRFVGATSRTTTSFLYVPNENDFSTFVDQVRGAHPKVKFLRKDDDGRITVRRNDEVPGQTKRQLPKRRKVRGARISAHSRIIVDMTRSLALAHSHG